jgi:Flp pilus assembly protein TadD
MDTNVTLRATCCALLLSLLVGCATPGSDVEDVEKELYSRETLMDSAESSLQQGNDEHALLIYTDLAKRYPKDQKILTAAAVVSRHLGKYNLSAFYYESLVALVPDNVDVKESLAEVNVQRNHLDEAEKQFNQLIEISPKDWRFWNGLAMVADIRGNYQKSDEYYLKAMELSPDNVEISNNRGYSLIMSHRYQDAEKVLREGLRNDPSDQRLRNNLIIALAWLGRYNEAVSEGRGIFNEWVVYNNVGYIAQLKGEYKTAEAFYQKAMSSSPRYYPRAAENLDEVRSLMNQN